MRERSERTRVTERGDGARDAVTHDRASDHDEPTPEQRRALFRVVRGTPTDAELAALTVVVALAAGNPPPPAPEPRSAWNDPAARLRTVLPVGPGVWRASTLPR